MPSEINCGSNWSLAIAGLWLLHSIFEAWLGKTDKTKAASTWELLFSVTLMLATIIIRRFYEYSGRNNSGS